MAATINLKHGTTKAPGQRVFAVADWNADHQITNDIDISPYNFTAVNGTFTGNISATTGNFTTIDLGTNTITDGNLTGSWAGVVNLTMSGTLDLGTNTISDGALNGSWVITSAVEPMLRINDAGASNFNREWVQIYNKDNVKMIEMGSNATGGPEIRFGDPENTKIGFPDTDPTYFAFTNDETDFWLGNAADPNVYINYYGGGNVYIGFAGVNVCDLTVNGNITGTTLNAGNGFTGTGAYTNFTIVNGIITAAS